ncbi:hypothetical protein K2X33_01095, partial [bacterium]|nr:hypothetical protein [bacterium]
MPRFLALFSAALFYCAATQAAGFVTSGCPELIAFDGDLPRGPSLDGATYSIASASENLEHVLVRRGTKAGSRAYLVTPEGVVGFVPGLDSHAAVAISPSGLSLLGANTIVVDGRERVHLAVGDIQSAIDGRGPKGQGAFAEVAWIKSP